MPDPAFRRNPLGVVLPSPAGPFDSVCQAVNGMSMGAKRAGQVMDVLILAQMVLWLIVKGLPEPSRAKERRR